MFGFVIILIGLLFGVEVDIFVYVIVCYFLMYIYSLVMGLLIMVVGLVIGIGFGLFSFMLLKFDSFIGFLLFGGILVLIGGVNFLCLGFIEIVDNLAY